MNRFLFCYKNEFAKLALRKKYIVTLIIAALFCFFRWGGAALIGKLIGNGIKIPSNIPLEMLSLFVEILVPIIIFEAAVDLISSENSSDTLKLSLMTPATRFKILLSKTAAAFTMGAVSLMLMFFISLAVQIITGGSLSSAGITFIAYLIDIIPLLCISCMAVFISVLLKSPSAAMLILLIIYAAMKYAGRYISGGGTFLFTSYSKLHTIILGTPLPLPILLYKIGILLGSVLILFSLSYIIFDAKDI